MRSRPSAVRPSGFVNDRDDDISSPFGYLRDYRSLSLSLTLYLHTYPPAKTDGTDHLTDCRGSAAGYSLRRVYRYYCYYRGRHTPYGNQENLPKIKNENKQLFIHEYRADIFFLDLSLCPFGSL